MKKTFLTLALAVLAAGSSFAQGLVGIGNSFLTPIKIQPEAGAARNAAAADSLVLSVFFGPAGSSADALTKVESSLITIGSTAGVLANSSALAAFALPVAGGETVAMQLRATAGNGLYYGETRVIDVRLASAPASGTPVWSPNNASLFTPLTLTVVPEPSTIALGVLGLGSLLLFRRRK